MVTGLSITEIQDRVSNGSIILDDGTINNPTTTGSVQSSDDQTAELNIEESSTEQSSSEKLTLTNSNGEEESSFPTIPVVSVIMVIIVGVCFVKIKNSKLKNADREDNMR